MNLRPKVDTAKIIHLLQRARDLGDYESGDLIRYFRQRQAAVTLDTSLERNSGVGDYY